MPAYQEIQAPVDPMAQSAFNFGQGFSDRFKKNQEMQQQQDIRTRETDELKRIFSELGPEAGPEDVIKSMFSSRGISPERAKTVGELIITSREKASKAREEKGLVSAARRSGLQDSFNRMSSILKGGSTGLVPGVFPKAREDRSEFDGLAANFEAALMPLVSKGALAKPRFDYLMSLLPKSNNTDATNRGLMKALAREFGLDISKLEAPQEPSMGGELNKEKNKSTAADFWGQ